MVTASFIQAAVWMCVMTAVIVVFVGVGDWLYQNERRRRREWLRAHRRHMDSVKPQRWQP